MPAMSLRATWDRARQSPTWACAAVASLLLVLPLLRVAARDDIRYVQKPSNGPRVTVHEHGGLFLLYGLVALLPALLAACFGKRFRWLNVTAVVVVALLAVICEAFVTFTLWPEF
jgi:hypothetical protein